MHYANGREARNGDKVVVIPSYGSPYIGILYDAQALNDYCNGKVAPISVSDPCPNLKECLHLDDVRSVLPQKIENVPDSRPGEPNALPTESPDISGDPANPTTT